MVAGFELDGGLVDTIRVSVGHLNAGAAPAIDSGSSDVDRAEDVLVAHVYLEGDHGARGALALVQEVTPPKNLRLTVVAISHSVATAYGSPILGVHIMVLSICAGPHKGSRRRRAAVEAVHVESDGVGPSTMMKRLVNSPVVRVHSPSQQGQNSLPAHLR